MKEVGCGECGVGGVAGRYKTGRPRPGGTEEPQRPRREETQAEPPESQAPERATARGA